MTFTVERSIEVDAAIDRVFTWMMEHDDWRRPIIREVKPLTEGPLRVGSRYENDVKTMGVSLTIVNEITAYDPPHRLSWKQVNETFPMVTESGNYILQELDDGRRTRVTLRNVHRPIGFGKVMTPLLKWMAGRIGDRLMPQLEEQLSKEL